MNLEAMSNLINAGFNEAVSSGLETVVSGIASTASVASPDRLEDLAALFTPGGGDLPVNPEQVGGLADYPDPLAFFDTADLAEIPDQTLVSNAEVRKLLADPQFDPVGGLTECVRGLFGERGIVDRCAGWEGDLEPHDPAAPAKEPQPARLEQQLRILDQMEATVRDTLRLHDRIGDGLGGRITG